MAEPKYVPPSLNETAFNCPHCGALTTQTWHSLRLEKLDKGKKPLRFDESTYEWDAWREIEEGEEKERAETWIRRMFTGVPFPDRKEASSYGRPLYNANVSECFNCGDLAIWLGSTIAWPVRGEAPPPNPDLPSEVRLDYDEAGRIFHVSPRGAAALLRLAIQKLCKELGEKGKHIDTDIAELVKKGLDVRVQRALDIVRVIGNESVHPGQIDMRDNVGTTEKLFSLVNLVAEAMISQPKHIAEMYGDLPEEKRKAIEKRDGPALLAAPSDGAE